VDFPDAILPHKKNNFTELLMFGPSCSDRRADVMKAERRSRLRDRRESFY